MRERLDEIIDRVAAELTVVPADPAFGARVRARLSPGRQRRPIWFAAVAGAAAVIAVAMIARFAGPPSHDPATDNGLASRTIEIGPTVPASAVPSEPGGASARNVDRGPVVATQEASDAGTSTAPALDTLSIDALVVEAMDVPAPAEIVPLDVPHLAIGDIASGEVQKEQK